MIDTPNPWLRDAEALLTGTVYSHDLPRAHRAIADALATAYELGHAQGRLAEIDRGRAEAVRKGSE